MSSRSIPNRRAYLYAERIRLRLPRVLQELRETCGMSRYALSKEAGVSRDMIGCIEEGHSIPTLYVMARLVSAMGMTLLEFVTALES